MGHNGAGYQDWEKSDDGYVRDHSGVDISVRGAVVSVNQRETEPGSLEPSTVGLYLDDDQTDLSPSEARAYAYAILMLADAAEGNNRRHVARERNAFELGRDAERLGL